MRIPLGRIPRSPGAHSVRFITSESDQQVRGWSPRTGPAAGQGLRCRGRCDADDPQDGGGELLGAKALSRATRNEYLSTLRKWERWGGGIPVEQLRRKDIREFLDWVYDQAVKGEGENPAARPTRPASTSAPYSTGPGSRN